MSRRGFATIETNAAEVGKAVRKMADDVRPSIERAFERAGEEALYLFRATTRTWRRDVRFYTDIDIDGDEIVLIAGTDDRIYNYVNTGTRPHEIRPRNGKRLAFKTGGAPKTAPWRIGSSGGSAGNKSVFTMVVKHPGTKARNFDIAIFKKVSHYAPLEIAKELQKLG